MNELQQKEALLLNASFKSVSRVLLTCRLNMPRLEEDRLLVSPVEVLAVVLVAFGDLVCRVHYRPRPARRPSVHVHCSPTITWGP